MHRRSRSPEYSNRAYSPSRPITRSPSPPRRLQRDREAYPPRPVDDWRAPSYGGPPPLPGRYGSPPRQRYGDDYPPPPRGQYEDDLPPPKRFEERRSPPPPPKREWRDWEERETRQGRFGGPPPRDDRRWQRGYEDDGLPRPAGYDQDRRATKGPSNPSRTVILLGLDPELEERDLMGYLRTEHRAHVESVKVVTDRATGQSKGFGFANFDTIADAEAFVNANYPAVLMPALFPQSDPRKVKIDFSITQEPSSAPVHHVKPGSDGMRDIGFAGNGNRVLLLRGLNFHSTGEDIARRLGQEISRLVGKNGSLNEGQGSICRVVLVVDRDTGSKWGFCFVEFVTTELATALLTYLISPQSQPNGFIIDDFPVAVSFANPAAFSPVDAGPLGSQHLVHASRNGGIGSDTIDTPNGSWVGYWHEQAGAAQTIPEGAPKINDNGDVAPISTAVRVFLGSLGGPVPGLAPTVTAQQPTLAPAASGPISISMTGMQPIKLGGPASKAINLESEGFASAPPKNPLQDDEDDPVDKDSVLLSRTKGVSSIIAPSSRKVAKNISRWNTKQTELKAPVPALSASSSSSSRPPSGLSEANAAISNPRQPTATPASSEDSTPSTATADFDYTDTSNFATTGKVACLLCSRQFKSQDVLRKHVAQSDLHKTNLLDAAACETGRRRKKAAIAATPTGTLGDDSGSKYRDRAAERREAHHQPDKPIPSEMPQGFKRKFVEAPSRPAPEAEKPAPPPVNLGKDEANVGNVLLSKMGWKAGTGLGLSGDGRVDPIAVKQFESRAGLGAGQGREAGRWDGPSGYQQRALDMAKERYHSSEKK